MGQHQWPRSPPACQHLAAAGSGTACPTWRGTLGREGLAWAEAQGSWPWHCLPLHLARELRQTDHSLCSNRWQWAMFCLIPFLKARNVSRPFWETGSGCYGSSHHPFLNCGNHGNKSSHSCWCTTPVTLANAPRKPRKDHENEQDWTIWLWVRTMAFCMRSGRALILSQSLFSAFCRSRAHGHRDWGSQIWQGEIGAATTFGISLHALMTQSCRHVYMKNASLNKRNLKGKFCFYAAWPWVRVVAEEGGAARARRQDQLTLWEQGVWQPGRHNYEASQCSYHFLGRDAEQVPA